MNALKRLILGLTAAALGFGGAMAETVTLNTPADFQVLSVSPNGKWACGVFIDAAMNTYGFRWDLTGGSIELLGAGVTVAWDVANDGTISGEFGDTSVLPNGAPMQLPGYWRDGEWHGLEMPKGSISDGLGGGISPDGHSMVGTLCIDGIYHPFIWTDGKIARDLNTGNHAVAYGVSPDGKGATGYSTKYNRTACYWQPDGTLKFFEDSKEYSMSPWNYGRNFSPDGTKLVYWGGWEVEGDDLYLYAMYDIEKDQVLRLQAPAMQSDLEFHDVSNDGTLVGSNKGRSMIYSAGELLYLDDYLTKRGVDINKIEDMYSGDDAYVGQLPIYQIVAISEDSNVMVGNYYNKDGQMASICIKMDQDLSAPVPAEFSAKQVPGISTVALNWKRPVGVNNIRGYNIYRDGTKINMLPVNRLYHFDEKVTDGQHTYAVSAITTAGVETRSEEVTVTVGAMPPSAPYDIVARQRGVNNAYVVWRAPLSDMVHRHYYNPAKTNNTGFMIYDAMTVEAAVAFDHNEMACYKGYTVAEVSFMPVGNHKSWAVNVYRRAADGSLTKLGSQAVDPASLTMGVFNTVTLDKPIAIPSEDLVVAVEISVDPEQNGLIAAEQGSANPNYSDLLRRANDDDTYISMYDSSLETGMSITAMAWGIDLGLKSPDAIPATLEGYTVSVNGNEVATVAEPWYLVEDLEDGIYNICVVANYGERVSDAVETSLTVKAKYPAVNVVDIEATEGSSVITAKWEAPLDNDMTAINYSDGSTNYRGVRGTSSNSYAMMVASDYTPAVLRGYEGYRIESLSFVPLSDALYTLILYKNGEVIYEYEPENLNFGKWNTFAVDKEIFIDETATYCLVVDCFDPEPDVDVLAVDLNMSFPYRSDLYSTDNGQTWNSFYYETDRVGNWLIGMTISNTEGEPMAVEGYDVRIDGFRRNNSTLTEPTFTYDFGEKARNGIHRLIVDVYYSGLTQSVRGAENTFNLVVSGINSAVAADITLTAGPAWLQVQGEGVKAVTLYSAAGAVAAAAEGSRVAVDHLPAGVYVAVVETSAGTVRRKVNIHR